MIEPHATALVTGASSGIGEQFARQLAARDMNLVLAARSEDRLQALAGELRKAHPGITVTVVPADLSDPAAPGALAARLADAGAAVDVLVNNAGFASHGPFAAEDPGRVAEEIQVNCGSLVALTAHLLPPMLARRRGGVVNVASTAAFQPIPTMAVYAATKAFVLSFTEALWAETRGSGVRVLALCPGATDTRFYQVAAAGGPEFMVRGRQSPQQVVAAALRAFESGQGAAVIPGVRNRVLAGVSRVSPHPVLLRVAQRMVRSGETRR